MNINDFIVPIAFMAIGAFSELLALRHPTPGERMGTIASVLSMSAAGFFIPLEWAQPAIVGFAVAKGGRVGGILVSRIIDKIRVWRVR